MSKPRDWNRYPHIVVWEATRACALACRHCRAEAQPCRHVDELQMREAFNLVDQVVRAKPGLFIITGGDPLMRRDLLPIIEKAAGAGLRVALSPSATRLLGRINWQRYREAGLHGISLSLDGATAETHDAFRGFSGTWQRTVDAFHAARDAGLFIQLNSTLTAQNLLELPDTAALVERLHPDVWSVFLIVPTGRGNRHQLPSPQATEGAFRWLAEHARQVPFRVKTTEGHHFRRILRQNGNSSDRPGHALNLADGRGFVFISHTGDIEPSGFLPIKAGNVRHDVLLPIYRHHRLFRQLRDPNQLEGKCGHCGYRKICGGSRARAYGMTGNCLAADPLCPYQPSQDAAVLVN